jgi:hypothetical protein
LLNQVLENTDYDTAAADRK